MKIFFLTLLAAYTGGNLYIFIKSLHLLQGASLCSKIIYSILFWLIAFSLFISLFTRDVDYPTVIGRGIFMTGSVWMVFTLYMVLALLVTDIIRIAMPSLRTTMENYGLLCALGATLLLLLYGYLNYRNPQINEIQVESPLSKEVTTPQKTIKIVAISDVHLGNGTGKKLLGKYVQMINRQNADIVFIAGDLIDNSVKPLYKMEMADELKKVNATMGIYMVPGNHEYISGIGASLEFIRQSGIKLLKDSVVALPCGITLIGRDDRSNRERKPLEELVMQAKDAGAENPVVLLDHQPYELAKSDSLGIFLQISGHTHRGQVWPLNWLTDKIYEQSHGYRKWKNSHIYVSSGLSLWGPPFRIGTKSDMAVIEIKL